MTTKVKDDSIPAVLRRRFKSLGIDGYNFEFRNVFKRAAEEIDSQARRIVELERMERAANALDEAICEFGTESPAYISEAAQRLHDVLHRTAKDRADVPPDDSRLAIEELKNLLNARRHDRDDFANDTEFADWALSRARYTLGLIEKGSVETNAPRQASPTVVDGLEHLLKTESDAQVRILPDGSVVPWVEEEIDDRQCFGYTAEDRRCQLQVGHIGPCALRPAVSEVSPP